MYPSLPLVVPRRQLDTFVPHEATDGTRLVVVEMSFERLSRSRLC